MGVLKKPLSYSLFHFPLSLPLLFPTTITRRYIMFRAIEHQHNDCLPKNDEETSMDDGCDYLSTLSAHIIQTHILTRVNAKTLASIAATCSQLRDIAMDGEVWAKLCESTWPSTMSPIVRHVMHRSPHTFFCDAVSLRQPFHTTEIDVERVPQLISAVDLYYRYVPEMVSVRYSHLGVRWPDCHLYRPLRSDCFPQHPNNHHRVLSHA